MIDKSGVIRLVMRKGIETINNDKEFNVKKTFTEYTQGDINRTTRIIIHEDDNPTRLLYDAGLGFDGDKIIEINKISYTVTYKFNVSTWLYLVRQDYEFRELFFLGRFTIEGESFFRDYAVWDKFWRRYHDIVKLNFFQKAFLNIGGGKL